MYEAAVAAAAVHPSSPRHLGRSAHPPLHNSASSIRSQLHRHNAEAMRLSALPQPPAAEGEEEEPEAEVSAGDTESEIEDEEQQA